jgi:hypothetical protein
LLLITGGKRSSMRHELVEVRPSASSCAYNFAKHTSGDNFVDNA